MLNFFIGAIGFYFFINIFLASFLIIAQWKREKKWKVKMFFKVSIFGLALILLEFVKSN